MDGNGRRLTSIDIWFRVLGDDAMFGLTGKYYSDRVEKLIRQIEDKTDQVIGEARDAYKQDLKASHDASIATQVALDKTKATADQLAIAIGQQQDYINARNIVTIKDFDALSDKVTKYVTDNFAQPTAPSIKGIMPFTFITRPWSYHCTGRILPLSATRILM